MYEEFTETTALSASTPQPTYTFDSSLTRQRKRKVRQFQCCVCAVFLSIIAVAMIFSIAIDINHHDNDNGTNITDETDSFMVLINEKIPLDNWNFTKLSKLINMDDYKAAVNAGKEALRRREIIEEDTPELDKDSPSYKHQKIVYTSCKARQLGKIGFAQEYATKHLNKIFNNHSKFCYNNTQDELFTDLCLEPQITCNLKYRTFDGTCNNRKFANYGVAYNPFRRLLKPQYADGISAPRVSVSGQPLPSARAVSLKVHRPIYKDDPSFTIMLAVFGQFLDHDVTATALSQGENGKSISCCSSAIQQLHPECFPVVLDPADPNRIKKNVTCMEFVRSLPAPMCCFGPREQLNQATSYIDGSVVYGDGELSRTLRTFTQGKLKMYRTLDGRDLLPPSEDANDGCNRVDEAAKGRYCFATGDGRANENLHLTSMHLLWARQHNRIASELAALNPHWDDETVFLEARKIIGAQLQHIAYMEFLPILLGTNLMEHFDLGPLHQGFYNGYNESVDASAANAFATAAFRFAHTLIPSLIRMIDNQSSHLIELRKMLFDPFQLYDNGTMDRALVGALHTNIEANDPYFSNELKQHMFERPAAAAAAIGRNSAQPKLCGLDLVSLNIQRGRDHGLPGYTSWREHCGLQRPRTFQHLAGDIDDDSLHHIGSIYSHVDDIDLYTGAISETPIEDGFLGPTLTCLILDQFVRLKQGDRYWYENPGQFTMKQLSELHKTSLARIICDNSDGVRQIQPQVMRKPSTLTENQQISCDDIPRVDFHVWQQLKTIPIPNDGIRVHVVDN